ncbi:MAG: YdcF family protein [Chitinophagaceae bacterium]|nr:YdcF family protein [Chitinophagaceae bacterium]
MFSPLNYILILAISGYLIKRKMWKRICYTAAVVGFLVFSNPALFNAYAKWYQPKPVVLPENSHYSFGIVPGGFGSVDDEGDGYFNSASDRFLQAVRLYKTGVIDHILISGGNSRDNDKAFREGAWAKQQMIQFGVPDSVIYIEDLSKGTKENAINSARILDSLNAKGPFVLISSAFHIPRAEAQYRNAGLDIIAYPCNYTEGRGPFKVSELIPSFNTLLSWPRYLKEIVGRIIKR